jgi:hypothetical protein
MPSRLQLLFLAGSDCQWFCPHKMVQQQNAVEGFADRGVNGPSQYFNGPSQQFPEPTGPATIAAAGRVSEGAAAKEMES